MVAILFCQFYLIYQKQTIMQINHYTYDPMYYSVLVHKQYIDET
jgi:hypothetical protein